MDSGKLCFCGSLRPHKECHGHIHPDSIVARLYAFEHVLDGEAAQYVCGGEAVHASSCGGCGRRFVVSEAEFIQILDELLRMGRRDLIRDAARRSKRLSEALLSSDKPDARPDTVANIVRELLRPDLAGEPSPCPLMDGEGRCPVYAVRPLACRIPDEVYQNGFGDYRACPRKPGAACGPADDVYSAALAGKILSFTFLKDGNRIIVRRPAPLYRYFTVVFRDESLADRLEETDFFRSALTLGESDYIHRLKEREETSPSGR